MNRQMGSPRLCRGRDVLDQVTEETRRVARIVAAQTALAIENCSTGGHLTWIG
jgi:hypothetical protein